MREKRSRFSLFAFEILAVILGLSSNLIGEVSPQLGVFSNVYLMLFAIWLLPMSIAVEFSNTFILDRTTDSLELNESRSPKEKNEKPNSPISKIVYFDEGSVADYIQIINKGVLRLSTELFKENTTSTASGVSTSAKASVGGSIKPLLGLEASVSADAAFDSSSNSGVVAKSIITNTVLTDFFDVLSDKDKNVEDFEGLQIDAIPGSLSHMALLTPYMAMLRSGKGIPAGEFNISIDKLDSTIKNAKGYFEFLGTNSEKSIILRFNNSSFKNNYRASDLSRMNLVVYAVQVGESTLEELNINRELNVDAAITQDDPDYIEEPLQAREPDAVSAIRMKMYDVILAGVKTNG